MSIYNQDHTLANMLCIKLEQNADVHFNGHRPQDPFEDVVVMYIRTNTNTTPKAAFERACAELKRDVALLETLVMQTLAK